MNNNKYAIHNDGSNSNKENITWGPFNAGGSQNYGLVLFLVLTAACIYVWSNLCVQLVRFCAMTKDAQDGDVYNGNKGVMVAAENCDSCYGKSGAEKGALLSSQFVVLKS